MIKKQNNPLDILVLLTLLFMLAQFLFLGIHYSSNLDGLVYTVLKSKLHLSTNELGSFAQFIISQLIVYVFYVYLLWYTVTALGELFALKWIYIRLLAAALWFISVVTILSANTYYASHSFFSELIRHNLFNDALTDTQLKWTLIFTASAWLFATGLACIHLCLSLYRKKSKMRHGIALTFIVMLTLIANGNHLFKQHHGASAATAAKPNIFIIGFDALRPDFLSFFNQHRHPTPHFDAFLKSSVVFTDTYTPLARTFPSWVSILSAQHPLHTHAREDMVDTDSVKLNDTLTQKLKQAGYDTIYACDDNRFSNINNKMFGFDRIIGPPGNATDFVISTLNDLPLSNLLSPTAFGKLLFPYNYANHASTHTYDPDNFLELIDTALKQRDDKPLFLAAHFNMTGWPFYWFNDHQPYSTDSLSLYKNIVQLGDRQLDKFLGVLEQNGLLEHAIFVLISDHGITLKIPGDRAVTEKLYQGNKKNIFLKRTHYNLQVVFDKKDIPKYDDEAKTIVIGDNFSNKDLDKLLLKILSPLNPNLLGIDTSWGYGNDVLSLKQYRPLLAIRTFGTNQLSIPHTVSGRSLLLDIAPTLLDVLNLPPLAKSEGVSLKPYLFNPSLNFSLQRPIYMESCYSFQEIEQEKIVLTKVLAKGFLLFRINPENDFVSMTSSAEKAIVATKQRAVLQGDWLLAYYPASRRYKMATHGKLDRRIETYVLPPYVVLLNLKTGKWTTNLNHAFSMQAPVKLLTQQLYRFYGDEMDYYTKKIILMD